MEFNDLKTQQQLIRNEIETNILRVLDHGQYIMGPEVFELEEKLADFVGVTHCIGVSSGTDALLIALMALDVGSGDEVITSPFSFIATAEVILLLGATPIFVDIDPKTYNINPNDIEQAITPKTKAIIPVSLFGQCANFDAINIVADKYQLPVIEDGAQSFGATYKGKKSCSLTSIGATSFFPSKPLGCYGDGGALFTDDDRLASRIKKIRIHGQEKKYNHSMVGINGRLDTIQAAILLAKFKLFSDEINMRQHVAKLYTDAFATNSISEISESIILPYIKGENTSVYSQYTIQTNSRDSIAQQMQEANIPTAVHYPIPLNLQPTFSYDYGSNNNCPVAEKTSKNVLSLPMHPYLKTVDINKIVTQLVSRVAHLELK